MPTPLAPPVDILFGTKNMFIALATKNVPSTKFIASIIFVFNFKTATPRLSSLSMAIFSHFILFLF